MNGNVNIHMTVLAHFSCAYQVRPVTSQTACVAEYHVLKNR